MRSGTVVQAGDIPADHSTGGATVRTLLDSGSGGPGLIRRLVEVPSGSRLSGAAAAAGELWFVIGGSASLDLRGHASLQLIRDRGVWIPAGAAYALQAGDGADLRLDVVVLPDAADGARQGITPARDPARPLTSDLQDCQVETTGDRKFRVLFGPDRGCSVATQFVGEIPPGRAGDHSHPYDELVLVLDGVGVAHIGGADHALAAGTCLHLPPGLRHCLENNGSQTLRVLGVFHPADSPAAKLAPDA